MDAVHRATIKAELAERLSADMAYLPVSLVRRLGGLGALQARRGVRALARRLTGGSREAAELSEAEQTFASLGRLKGLPMKVGQLLSYVDTSLPDESGAALSVLQTWAQPLPFDVIQGVVMTELGRRGAELLRGLDRHPVGVASIGQVHRATLPDGTVAAVKVQYPDIDKAVDRDVRPAAIGARVTTWLNRAAKRDVFVAEARARFIEECDYEHEARRQRELATRFAEHPTVRIPDVIADFSARRVLTTEFVEGVHLDEFLASDPSQDQIDRVGTALFDFYYGALFVHGIYNCDPHPGNYLFCPDGRVAILDHGCTRAFEPGFVARLSALTRAVAADDRGLMQAALVDMGIVDQFHGKDHARARQLLRWFYGPMLRDKSSKFTTADANVRKLTSDKDLRRFAVPGEFLFLVRMRVGIAAVLARMGARANWRALQVEYLDEASRQLAAPEPFAQVPAEYDVVLVAPGDRIIEVLREVRDLLGIGVREAKDLVDAAPSVVKPALSRRQAGELQARLEAAGGVVQLRRSSG